MAKIGKQEKKKASIKEAPKGKPKHGHDANNRTRGNSSMRSAATVRDCCRRSAGPCVAACLACSSSILIAVMTPCL